MVPHYRGFIGVILADDNSVVESKLFPVDTEEEAIQQLAHYVATTYNVDTTDPSAWMKGVIVTPH